MLSMLLASTVVVGPLHLTGFLGPPPPPPLPPATKQCSSVEPSPSTALSLTAHVDTHGDYASLSGRILHFLPNGDNRSASAGMLYYRLDRESPVYVWIEPSGDTQGASYGAYFTKLNNGPHFLDFALVSNASPGVAYGRICFRIRPGESMRYEFL